ncbi:ATP-binding protein [Trinickia violacea]|uniref:ATP-binding protein n=1 Tax=Trinickia violacea TaxID=2571746 RepID=A0A4P8IMQ1_9BURK|nr:ATP-binding protein [Trinickia violacea]QCP49097.1 ATP-binding protein [Trinickia violacea]
MTNETAKKREATSGRRIQQAPVRQCRQAVEAEYYQGDLPQEYKENPLISALGPLWDSKSILRSLSVPVAYSDDERSRPEEYRLNTIGRLSRLFVPLPAHLEIVNIVQMIIRQHYVDQTVSDVGSRGACERYTCAQDNKLIPIYPHKRSHAYCAGIFGLSGAGKTTALEGALRFLPKVIHHSRYGINQVVWIKIDCPRSASLKDTIKLLLLTFDELLGTECLDEIGTRATLADYANKLHRVARRHYTGLIILDEMQNALQAVVRNDPLFDFFVNFTNVVGIPVIVSGTPKAAGLFRKTLRSARRISSQGVITWNGMKDMRDWNRFCDQLEKYQWLANAAPLSRSIRQYLYALTQGLPGIAIPLYQLAQYNAIYTGVETLSRQILRDTFDERMDCLRPLLAAIRSGNKARMAQYEDLLGDTLKDIVASTESEARRHMYQQAAMEHDKAESAIDATSRLLLLGVAEDIASSLIDEVQKEFPSASTEDLSAEAARRYFRKHSQRESLKRCEKKPKAVLI